MNRKEKEIGRRWKSAWLILCMINLHDLTMSGFERGGVGVCGFEKCYEDVETGLS